MAANGHLKMSEAVSGSEPDMDAYTQLTDDVFQQILHSQSTDAGMQTVQFCLILNLLAHSVDMHIITNVFFSFRLVVS